MKLRSIGIAGLALVLAALILGSLGPSLWPGAFWNGQSGAMMGSGMMNGSMMSGGMMARGMMNGSTMGGGMMSGGMMARGMMNGSTMGGVIENSNASFDQRFLDQMIAHHQMAVTSAQRMIGDSARPELRDLAQRIITGQQREIDQMQTWRQEWYGSASTRSMPSIMGGAMMNRDQMRQMMGASTDFDRMFLQMMIPHHEAAIAMAEQALTQAQHPEIKTLAQNIITTQRAEIGEMQSYLTQ
jgi:uncharacterized protein (DUF305 family)